MTRIWYVAYGSNLGLRRFRCYLAGGRPAGGSRSYEGCRDPADPKRTAGVVVRGALVFAGDSGVWGGGMAFLDPEASSEVACRAYLVTADQLADVAAQEMRRHPGGDFARTLVDLLDEVVAMHSVGPGRYETVARLGEVDGTPMFTVTCSDPDRLTPVPPTAPYLRSICLGLREAHGWEADRVADYLLTARGVDAAWSRADLRHLAATSVEHAE
ncbi:MAG: histone deacetylase [Nocardioides sp.]